MKTQNHTLDFSSLYGVVRNYERREERRYVYTGEQLVRLENEYHKTFGIQDKGFHPEDIPVKVTEASLDGFESSFWSNDTYTIHKLHSEEELKEFLFVAKEGICDCENPTLRELADTWSALQMDCMYTGEENETVALILAMYGDITKETVLRDPRYQELLVLGMP